MKIQGNISKDGKFWLVEFPVLDAMTQGRTRAEALEMARDLIACHLDAIGMVDTVEIALEGSTHVVAQCSDPAHLVALILRRRRQASGRSVREVAAAMNQSSPTAYAKYESGRSMPSAVKLDELLAAVDGRGLVLA